MTSFLSSICLVIYRAVSLVGHLTLTMEDSSADFIVFTDICFLAILQTMYR